MRNEKREGVEVMRDEKRDSATSVLVLVQGIMMRCWSTTGGGQVTVVSCEAPVQLHHQTELHTGQGAKTRPQIVEILHHRWYRLYVVQLGDNINRL